MVAKHVEEMQKRNEELNDKLSAGTYAYKQIRNLVINFIGQVGGAVVGWYAGAAIKSSRLQFPQETIKQYGNYGTIAKSIMTKPGRWLGAFVGSTAGSIGAMLVLGYEHWAKAEAQRLAVDEINKDISEARLRMDPELLRENRALREMVAKQDSHLKRGESAVLQNDYGKKIEQPKQHVVMRDAVHEAPERAGELAVG